MTRDDKTGVEAVVDEVWSGSLWKIVKNRAGGPVRKGLGDDLDIVVPQAATAAIMAANPAFANVLYSAAYTSAKRNAYLLTRQVGMPADFFWKFDYWTQERAFETLHKVIARIFGALMSKQKEGTLELASVDVERGQFTIAFADCAECFDLHSVHPMCFFHAGLFAGILGALLDRDLDAAEVSCSAQGKDRCTFRIGKRDDRDIRILLEERTGSLELNLDITKRFENTLKGNVVRAIGNTVDVGYYQLLLSSTFLGNMSVLSTACLNSGTELGQALAPLLRLRYQGDAGAVICSFYRELRYMDVRVDDKGSAIEVHVTEAPEMSGPMARAALIPFFCGELQSLLSALSGRAVVYRSSAREDAELVLLFSP